MTILVVLAAHQGEEFVIILPAIMLIGAFFIMRWANQNDKADDDDEAAEAGPREERPEGFVLPKLKIDDEVVLSGAASSRARPDADETTR